MTSENKKKAITSLIVVVITLIGLVISATYAYYGADTSNSFGTKTMTAGAETTGNVALNGINATIYLNLTTANMRKETNDITYWGVTSGDPVTTQNVVTIGSTSVTGGKTYNCSYSGTVTASGTNNMYTAFQSMTGKSADQIVLKIGENTYDFNTANLFPISISGTLNGLTSSNVANITAEFYLVNKSSVDQTDLAGTDISINVSITNFSCTVPIPPTASESLAELCEEDNTVVAYNGKVTDSVEQIGEGVDATKVCAFTSNNTNNLVFANHCWQIRRTTETGGIKIQYNGEPTLGTSNGKTTYDCGTTRPYHMGYVKIKTSLTGTYLYGTGYTTSVSGSTTTFTLTDTSSVTVNSSNAETVIPTLAGKYTCKNATGTCTNTGLYKVDSYINSYNNAYVYPSAYRDSIGNSEFNTIYSSIGDVGYMYNKRYSDSEYNMSSTVTMLSTVTLNSSAQTTYGNYFYSDAYTMNGNSHVLTNAVQGTTIDNYPSSWVGKYRCNSILSSSCGTMYYVSGINSSETDPIMYQLSVESGKQATDSSLTYIFSDGISDNGDGTFTMMNPQVVYRKDWYSNYSSLNNKYVCLGGYWTNNNGTYTCSDNGVQIVGALRYVTATTATSFTGTLIYKFGYGIEQSGNNFILTAKDGESQTLQYLTNWSSDTSINCFASGTTKLSSCGYKTLSKSHYTCYNLSGICSSYYYINSSTSSMTYSILISGGKYVSTDLTDLNNVLYEMLNASNLNNNSSTVKGFIDLWYQSNLLNTGYENLIERDTVFCNDRRVASFGGWNPDGGTTDFNDSNSVLKFAENTSTSNLNCNRSLDSFSTNNSLASLDYPIGLMSNPEMYILGNTNVRKAADTYWQGSANRYVGRIAFERSVYTAGDIASDNVSVLRGVRPAIVLNSSATFSSGTGTTADPWIVTGSEMTP